MKNNEVIIEELKEQIKGWRQEQERIDDMVEAAHKRIDELSGQAEQEVAA
jgi:hypothetical protein